MTQLKVVESSGIGALDLFFGAKTDTRMIIVSFGIPPISELVVFSPEIIGEIISESGIGIVQSRMINFVFGGDEVKVTVGVIRYVF